MSIGPYFTGDQPATPVEFDLETDEDLDGYTSAHIILYTPGGTIFAGATVPVVDATAVYTFPDLPFMAAGVWELRIVLLGQLGAKITLPVQQFVVQSFDGWHNLDSIRRVWTGAPNDDATLWELLEVSRGQILAYARKPAPDADDVPLHYRRAQYMQARNIWNAAVKDSGGEYGGEGFAVTVFPLEWNVKNLIRPKRGVPVVG